MSEFVPRRQLKFESLEEIPQDARHLLAVGYTKVGKWSLAQCCGHLSNWYRYQLDGFPQSPFLLRPLFWFIRNTFGGKRALKMMLEGEGTMKAGMGTIPSSIPAPGGDDTQAMQELESMIRRWQTHTGTLYPSPLLGQMTREESELGHRIHAAHHLSFLIPKEPRPQGNG